MRYVCTECEWAVDSADLLSNDPGALAIEHHIRFGHPVELATDHHSRAEQTDDRSAGT